MALFTLHMGYWRHGRNPFTDEGEHMRVTIYRISQVPTVQVYMNNLSVWSPGYNGSEVSPQVERDIGGNEHWLHDNTLPVDFCWLTASFFLVSAVFHLWALVVGIFERTWYMYWRCSLEFGSTLETLLTCSLAMTGNSTTRSRIGDGPSIQSRPVSWPWGSPSPLACANSQSSRASGCSTGRPW